MAETGWLKLRVRQTGILLKKNGILMWRNKRNTCIQIFAPAGFLLLLFILQFAVKANQRQQTLVRTVHDPTVTPNPGLQPCTLPPYISDKTTMCYTLAYVSLVPAHTDQVFSLIMSTNSPNIPAEKTKKFDTVDALNQYQLANPGTIQASVILNATVSPGALFVNPNLTMAMATHSQVDVSYSVQFNQTAEYTVWNVAINKFETVLFPLTVAAESAIVKYVSGNANFNMNINRAGYPHPELSPVDVIASFGPPFLFAALMFNFVIQMGQIVTEKELKLREAMNMMGLKDISYWMSWFISNAILNTLASLSLVAAGAIFQFDFFLKNAFGTYFFLFFLFSLSMVPFTMATSVIVSKSSTATTLGFVVFLIGFLMQGFAQLIYNDNPRFYPSVRIILSLFPFVLLGKGIGDISSFSDSQDDPGMTWAQRTTNPAFIPLTDTYALIIMDFFIYVVLTWYLDNVVPGLYGTSKPLYFFLTPSYWCGQKKKAKKPRAASTTGASDVEMSGNENQDVAEERRAVLGGGDDDFALRINGLVKTYSSRTCTGKRTFTAVKGIHIGVKNNSLFCLLGHNGAGKTTTIGMLTGLFGSSGGEATIFGMSIDDEMDGIRKVMGVCPQHDILWNQLSGEEHLRLFGSLKQIPADRIEAEVAQRLEEVGLTDARKRPSALYSGGMRRRLSTAIALTGDPKIVFLDEPTTGMDPISRRKVWNLIESVKKDRVIILTTHSMEEADVLGDRISIMKHGELAAIGTSLHLKAKYGSGYTVSVLHQKGRGDDVRRFFASKLKDFAATSSTDTTIDFTIDREQISDLPGFFRTINEDARDVGVTDTQLCMTSLEEVFLRVASEGDEHHAAFVPGGGEKAGQAGGSSSSSAATS